MVTAERVGGTGGLSAGLWGGVAEGQGGAGGHGDDEGSDVSSPPQTATTKVPEVRDVTRIERIGE